MGERERGRGWGQPPAAVAALVLAGVGLLLAIVGVLLMLGAGRD